jgi:hypothetical protein
MAEAARPALPALRRRGDPELPLGRLLRLSLFQVSVGMAVVLLTGTLNRVMILELGVPGLARRPDGVAALVFARSGR